MESICKLVTIIFNYICSVTAWHIPALFAYFLFFQFLNINLPYCCTHMSAVYNTKYSKPTMAMVQTLSPLQFLQIFKNFNCTPWYLNVCILYCLSGITHSKSSSAPYVLYCYTKHRSCKTIVIDTTISPFFKTICLAFSAPISMGDMCLLIVLH